METAMDNETESLQAWTEVNHQSEDYNPFVKVPLLTRATQFSLCRMGREPEQVRQSFVVFRAKGTTEWEDNAPLGRIEAMVLGDDDEEVRPTEVINLGVDPADFLTMVRQDAESTTFRIDWYHGEVRVEGAKKTDEGYKIHKADCADGKPLTCTLMPDKEGDPFTLELQLPFSGFNITGEDGAMVVGDLTISSDELDKYTYRFEGNEDDDRFAVSLDDLAQSYQYIWYEDGTLSVRNLRKKMEKVREQAAQGKLSELLQGSRNALVKHKDTRWRIIVTKALQTEEAMDLNAVDLCRMVFTRFQTTDVDEDALIQELIAMEDHHYFQWMWLKSDDWQHEYLADLMGLDGIEQDQEKMMQLALRYNQFDRFMQKLRRASLDEVGPVQADALQMRNNKRKIARCLKRLERHQQGEESLWEADLEEREEQLLFFRSYHSAFETVD